MEGYKVFKIKMKRIIYTQRVETVKSYGERRDCADQKIAELIWECGYMPIAINNIPSRVQVFVENIKPEGIVLTGGNDLAAYGGDALERDETETFLLQYGIEMNIPIYGFCRGMQSIANYFGMELVNISGHVATRHILVQSTLWEGREVNSFHNMAVKQIKDPFLVEARSNDGIIEAFRHKNRKIYATMWHPERENLYAIEDINYIKQIFS